MTEVLLTPQEAADSMLMSVAAVYAWIEQGILDTRDLPNGKAIVTSPQEIHDIKMFNIMENNAHHDKIKALDNARKKHKILPINNATLTKQLLVELRQVSEAAGKYEVLKALYEQNKATQLFWQNEFFRMDYELKKIQSANISLAKELKRLKLENKRLRDPFRWFKKIRAGA